MPTSNAPRAPLACNTLRAADAWERSEAGVTSINIANWGPMGSVEKAEATPSNGAAAARRVVLKAAMNISPAPA